MIAERSYFLSCFIEVIIGRLKFTGSGSNKRDRCSWDIPIIDQRLGSSYKCDRLYLSFGQLGFDGNLTPSN
ncbi:hypothetical protein [Arthrospira sp. PCC 8006]|uniref:hypothetical protein n=1 Tax=Oscillatoriales TaxID=1150 RepID=UPI00396F3B75